MDHERIPQSPAALPLFPSRQRPWWKRPVVALTVVLSAASFGIGAALATSGDDSDAPSESPRQGQSQPVDQPAGLSYQQKQSILFKFCTSSRMRGEAGDSSAFPACMGDYYVTDQGMVMPK
ncbi:hypothetical protein ABT185_10750 [Streptomyces clavifer]|uniref:hypothetical protein n=1 Tax=Streptomyces clavifer TaxID=68188 RepID=UPI00332EF5FD